MRRRLFLIVTLVCLLNACQTTNTPLSAIIADGGSDSASIYQEKAYQEMFADSLGKAEEYAFRAVMLSSDSMLERSSLALLCYIYYREGKQEQLQLLMQTVSPETTMDMMDVQKQVEQAKAGRDRQVYTIIIILVLLVSGIVCYWFVHRIRSLSALYRQRIESVRLELQNRESDLTRSAVLPIGETKMGIDVLFAIINGQNISQMGKQEEQAVLQTLPMVDSSLAALLDKVSSPMTPKETFYCIMEYYGKSDRQKARSFCCSEQAIRSTKSRLGKKIDVSIFRSE